MKGQKSGQKLASYFEFECLTTAFFNSNKNNQHLRDNFKSVERLTECQRNNDLAFAQFGNKSR